MSRPYLLEIRTGGDLKQLLRDIIYDVADRFDVQGAASPRAVPHVTLFGPYNTNRGREVKSRLADVFADYDAPNYRIDGFGHFRENNVIYANVVPSEQLRALRRDISRVLRAVCYNYPDYDADYYYDFHITIAFKDVGRQFDAIWEYVTDEYTLDVDAYASRITNLRKREMLWEYDLATGELLESDIATSAESWRRTEKALQQRADTTRSELAPKPSWPVRMAHSLVARLNPKW